MRYAATGRADGRFDITEAEAEVCGPGDMDGRGVWIKVLEVVRELTDTKPPDEGEAVH